MSRTAATSATRAAGGWAGRLRGENNEGLLAACILALIVAMSLVDPGFWAWSTAFGVLRNSLVTLMLGLGFLIVLISGGIDVSFAAIAIFAGYTSIVIVTSTALPPTPLLAFALAAAIGTALGSLNAVIVANFRIHVLILTLGTRGIITGALLAFVGTDYISTLPGPLDALSTADLVRMQTAGGTLTRLHLYILPVAAFCVIVALLLRRTTLGRSVYAIGGDVESARRVGVPIARTQAFIYLFVGFLAGVAGMMHTTLARHASPHELVGTELDVIAAVVLGGASIFGGRGSVTGTVLGVLLISLIQNSLVLLGVPSIYQQAAVGVLLLIGISMQSLGGRLHQRRVRAGRALATGGAS